MRTLFFFLKRVWLDSTLKRQAAGNEDVGRVLDLRLLQDVGRVLDLRLLQEVGRVLDLRLLQATST